MRDKALIGIVAPSRALVKSETEAIFDEEKYQAGKRILTALNWDIKEAANLRAIENRFAGNDEIRAREFERMMLDADVDVALSLRGGYGAHRILPLVDWEKLKTSSVAFVGFSDTTAVNMALLAKAGLSSWQGPTVSILSKGDKRAQAALSRAMREKDFSLTLPFAGEDLTCEGTLWGGNLSIIASLIGTPYFPKIKEGLLYLEDVAEPAWRIERMLLQLREAHVLDQQKVILLGSFTGAERGQGEGACAFTMKEVITHIQELTGVPVLTGLPFGHMKETLTLPFGVRAALSFQKGEGILTAFNVSAIFSSPQGESEPPRWWH